MALEVIKGRIAENLDALKAFTATPGNGCTRLPFTKEARDAVEYLKTIMAEAGLEVFEDVAGNVFGIMKGEDETLPCVMMGSHYDSVKNGGDYDGIAGVICAIEVARQLKDAGFAPKRNFVVVGFCDEEGMRFGTGYFGSGAMLGKRDVEYCKKFKDTDGISIYDAMKSYGLDPEVIEQAKWPEGSIGSFLEAHIEQGPVLDAVDAATKVISKIPDWAREKGAGTVATTGYIKTTPGGMNIVAEKVEFTVDIRSTNNDYINDITSKIRAALDFETEKMGGSYEMDNKLTITPVDLSEEMLQIMEDDCKEKGYSCKRLPSGAGHDALEIGQVIPTVMLFVPSKDGRSHCPVEHTEYSEFAKASVIMSGLAQKLLAR